MSESARSAANKMAGAGGVSAANHGSVLGSPPTHQKLLSALIDDLGALALQAEALRERQEAVADRLFGELPAAVSKESEAVMAPGAAGDLKVRVAGIRRALCGIGDQTQRLEEVA